MQLHINPSSKAMNGLGGVFTAIGKGGTLTANFNPVSGDLNFSFSTLEEGHLVLGAASYDGIMQISIIALGDNARMLSSRRVVLNPDGSEGHVDAASDGQLLDLTERFNAARGILETLIITVDEQTTLTYEFLDGERRKAAGAIARGAPPAAASTSTP